MAGPSDFVVRMTRLCVELAGGGEWGIDNEKWKMGN